MCKTLRTCPECGEPLHSSIPKTQSKCNDCEPVELPKLIPPVYANNDGDLLYVDKIAIRDFFRYAIFYRNHETNFDADLTRMEINFEAQLDRFSVVLALRKMVDCGVRSAGWKRVA